MAVPRAHSVFADCRIGSVHHGRDERAGTAVAIASDRRTDGPDGRRFA
jgi:hypothetical protein